MSIINDDKKAREMIRTETGSNIFVEAGAGSGKTTALVDRIVSLVEKEENFDISRVCAVTFTKAAAAEFHKRFSERLSRLSLECTDPALKKKYEKALENIDFCFMGTIDSFAEMILREHPMAAGVPSDFTVSPESEMKDALRNKLIELINGVSGSAAETELKKKYDLLCKVSDKPRELFFRCFEALMKKHGTKIVYEKPADSDIDTVFKAEKDKLLQMIKCIKDNKDKIYLQKTGAKDKYVKKFETFGPAADKLENESWNGLFTKLKVMLKGLDKFKLNCPPEDIGIELKELFDESQGGYVLHLEEYGLYNKMDEYVYSVTMDLIVSSLDVICNEFKQEGRLSFYEAQLALRDMLKEDIVSNGCKRLYHIAERHSCFLVDEFQDTTPLQTEILFYLTAENPDPDWTKCTPRKGSLFIVGDPKQSIFRFNNADIKAFNKVRDLFESNGDIIVELTENFRSTLKMKEKFNEMFTDLMPGGDPYQSEFKPIPLTPTPYDSAPFGGVYRYKTDAGEDPYNVVKIINKIVNDPDITVPDTENKTLRRARYSDIMLITYNKPPIKNYIKALSDAGIPYQVEGSSLMNKCEALKSLTAILSSAAEPDNSLSSYKALTGVRFKVSDRELLKAVPGFSFRQYDRTLTELDHLNDAKKELVDIYEHSRDLMPSALCSYILNTKKLLVYTSDEELECLYFAIDNLRAAEADGTVRGLKSAVDFLNKLIDSDKTERMLNFDPTSNKVRVANLHKVKGLESNIVILAGTRAFYFEPDIRTELENSEFVTHLFKNEVKNDFGGYTTLISTGKYSGEFTEEEKELEAERCRLLYVAATRACSALLIADIEDAENQNPWRFLLGYADKNDDLFGDDSAAETAEEVKTAELYGEEIPSAGESYSNDRSYDVKLPSKQDGEKAKTAAAKAGDESQDVSEDQSEPADEDELINGSENNEPIGNPDDEDAEREKTSRAERAFCGTLVHRLMERIVSAPSLPKKEDVVGAVIAEFEAPEEYREKLCGVYDTLTSGGFPQKNGSPQDILAELSGASDVYCEVPFCYKNAAELWNGILDLVYCKGGEWHIVDYKTNLSDDGLEDHYSAQLRAYEAAMLETEGITAKARIYHIDV